MKLKTTTMLALTSLGIGAAQAATVTWEGGAGNWHGNANWNVGGTAGQNAPDQTANDDDIFISSGDVTYNPGGDLGLGWGATNITVSGGTLTQSTTHWTRFNGSGSLTVSGGTVSIGANNFHLGESSGDTASLAISSGALNYTGGGEFKIRGANAVSISGGLLSSRFYSIGDFGFTTVDLSGGIMRINDSTVGTDGIYTASGSYIDITANGVFNVGNIDVATATGFYLDTNIVRQGGDTNNALLQVVSDGSGGVNISVVPEPSSTALLGLGGLALILRRRK